MDEGCIFSWSGQTCLPGGDMSYLDLGCSQTEGRRGLLEWEEVVCKGMDVGRGGSSAKQKWKRGLERQLGTKLLRAMNTS